MIAAARSAVPAIASRFESWSMCSLSCSRHRSRWYADGAMRSAVATAVQRKAAKKTSSCAPVRRSNRCVNGTASRNAKRTCTPGSATRSSLRSSISSRSRRSSLLSSATPRRLRHGLLRTRIRERRQNRLYPFAQVLEVRRQGQSLTEMLERLVGRETRADGRDLEQDAARLAEVDRTKVVAVDHRRWGRAALQGSLAPGLVLLHRRGPRDVVNRSPAADTALLRLVVRVERAALLSSALVARLACRLELERTLQELPARLGVEGVG